MKSWQWYRWTKSATYQHWMYSLSRTTFSPSSSSSSSPSSLDIDGPPEGCSPPYPTNISLIRTRLTSPRGRAGHKYQVRKQSSSLVIFHGNDTPSKLHHIYLNRNNAIRICVFILWTCLLFTPAPSLCVVCICVCSLSKRNRFLAGPLDSNSSSSSSIEKSFLTLNYISGENRVYKMQQSIREIFPSQDFFFSYFFLIFKLIGFHGRITSQVKDSSR